VIYGAGIKGGAMVWKHVSGPVGQMVRTGTQVGPKTVAKAWKITGIPLSNPTAPTAPSAQTFFNCLTGAVKSLFTGL
jgi:hypothetical protein